MSDYRCTGKDKVTSGWPILQTSHLDSTTDCGKMGHKGGAEFHSLANPMGMGL
jgi:hypothetical protein